MASKKPVVVGDLEFSSKAEAKQFFRSIRDCYADGEILSQEHQGVVLDLVALHPDASDKIGTGVAHFTVQTEKEFGRTRHFEIHYKDGSTDDFSFLTCIDGRSLKNDVFEALRRAIASQVIDFRTQFFVSHATPIICPLVGTLITPTDCHVDHVPPQKFAALVIQWMMLNDLAVKHVEITAPGKNQTVSEMTSSDQQRSWTDFHRENATLRVLSRRGNLSHANKRSLL